MEETAMELTPKHLELIGDYVRGHLHEWIAPENSTPSDDWRRDMQERTIRIEESVRLGFDYMEKRFEQVERRFEQSDKRFDDLIHSMDKRFELVERRIEQVDKRFEQVDKRFEQVDKRFDDLIHFMDKRFEQVDKRFDQQFKFLTTGFVLIGVLMSVYQFLA